MRFISYASKDDSTVKFGYFTPEEWREMQKNGYFEVDLSTFNGEAE